MAIFAGIKNLSQNKDYSGDPIVFQDVSVNSFGYLSKTEEDRSIQGAFYGKEKPEEISGVFDTPEILGAFGTKPYPIRAED